jgi:cysteinyl-tRNA synthetase
VLDLFDKVLSLDLTKKAAARREELQKQAAAAKVQAVIFDGCEENEEIKALAEARVAAKKAKNFAEADRLRDEVIAKGYLIEDTAQGPKIKKA